MLFRISILALTFSILAPLAHSETMLPVVGHYNQAADAAVWKTKVNKFRDENPLPAALIETVEVADPSQAFRAPYGNIFLQNERIVVCNHECGQAQNLKITQNGKNFAVALEKGTSRNAVKLNDSMIRQANVYYWINKLFDRMEQLGFTPQKRLIVYVDRLAKDAESGVIEDNNAYFNDKDWTLTFLPAENSLFTFFSGAGFYFPSAYDPSVTMHETTHSVFEALIGPILNSELLGLHEAFADYFAMAVLDSPIIGRIMTRGKSLRDASVAAKYEADMEAHDLGHVVGAALWSLRQLFTDKVLADRIALDTIREVSRNTFATAASVSVAYETVLKRLSNDAALAERAMKIWADTGLVPQKIEVNVDAIKGKIDSSEHAVTSFVVTVPDWVVMSQGMKKQDQITIGIIEARKGPDADTTWILVSTEDDKSATAYWLLYSSRSKNILAAYDLTLTPVSSGLTEIGDALSDAIVWNQEFGKSIVAKFKAQFKPYKIGPVPVLPSFVKDHKTSGFVTINNRVLAAKGHYVTMRGPLTPVKWYQQIVYGKHYGELQSVRGIRLITVASTALKDDQLIEAYPGEKLVGYEITSRTGVSKKTMLTGIAETASAAGALVTP